MEHQNTVTISPYFYMKTELLKKSILKKHTKTGHVSSNIVVTIYKLLQNLHTWKNVLSQRNFSLVYARTRNQSNNVG